MLCVIFGLSLSQIWDILIIFRIFLLSLTLYLMARIEWKDVKRTWLFITILVVFIVGLNALIAGRGGPTAVLQGESPIIYKIPI